MVEIILVLDESRPGHGPGVWFRRPSLAHVGLKCLSLVCRTTRAIAQPLLFRTLSFKRDLQKSVHRLQALHRMLDLRPEASRWIQILEFEHCQAPEWQQRELYAPLASLFVRLDGLVRAKFGRVPISRGMYAHLYTLCTLQYLDLHDVLVEEDVNLDHQISNLAIRSLTIDHWTPSLVRNAALGRLARSPALQSLQVFFHIEMPIFDPLLSATDHAYLALARLNLHVPLTPYELDQFLQFGQMCPNVYHLNLRSAPNYPLRPTLHPDPHDPLDNIFPQLQYFRGPMEFVGPLIRDRPVEVVVISEWLAEDLSQGGRMNSLGRLAWGSVDLKVLEIVGSKFWYERCVSNINEFLPLLEVLALRLSRSSHEVTYRNRCHWILLMYFTATAEPRSAGDVAQLSPITLLPTDPKPSRSGSVEIRGRSQEGFAGGE